MKLLSLLLVTACLLSAAVGHITDADGRCIAQCPKPKPPSNPKGNYAVVNTTLQEEYSCGTVNTTYSNTDRVVLCLFFDQMDPPQKVVFSPRVDSFEVLQIKGLYDKFHSYNKTTGVRLSVTAMASGVISKPTVFKQNDVVASVLELQVTMVEGNITRIDWIHGCSQCGPYQCATGLVVNEKGYGMVNEKNCYTKGDQCKYPAAPECDTQVFVTWTGTDRYKMKGKFGCPLGP